MSVLSTLLKVVLVVVFAVWAATVTLYLLFMLLGGGWIDWSWPEEFAGMPQAEYVPGVLLMLFGILVIGYGFLAAALLSRLAGRREEGAAGSPDWAARPRQR